MSPSTAKPLRRGWRDAALAGVLVTTAHALLLTEGAVGLRRFDAAPPAPAATALRVRTIAMPGHVLPAPDPLDSKAPATVPGPEGRTGPVLPRVSAAGPGARRSGASGPAKPASSTALAAAPDRESPRGATESTATPPSLPDDGRILPPVYATQVAPPFVARFGLFRGSQTGSGELAFSASADGYELTIQGELGGLEAIALASRGTVDVHGLAPVRFTERRRGRDRQAANFDRVAGRITYSGPQTVHGLPHGTQDRLSWMVQLPAIVQADPARWTQGATIVMFVSGARGEADAWTFEVKGLEDIGAMSGLASRALHLSRQPTRPYDTRVEIWLDPERHHLPALVQLTTVPGGETVKMRRTN